MSAQKKTHSRNDLTLEEKIKLLDWEKELPPGISKTQAATVLGISRRSLARLHESEASLRASFNKGKQRGKKRKRDGKDAEVGEALTLWFANVRDKQHTVTGCLLKEKAVCMNCLTCMNV